MDNKTKQRKVPVTMSDIDRWRLSRRTFVKGMALAGIASQLPFIHSCFNENPTTSDNFLVEGENLTILRRVQQILFPDDGNGPGAEEINADKYLLWVLSDPNMDPGEKKYIINGITWVNETSMEMFNVEFNELNSRRQEDAVEKVSKFGWGENWLSVILTFIFEALLADPQYGGNPDTKGWKWLSHYAGYPRPVPELLYDTILQTIRQP